MSFINEKSKKYITLLLLVLLMFVMSGCALFDVGIGIDSNNTAYLSYHLELDVSTYTTHQQHNFKEALYQIAMHYHHNLDFSVNLETDANPLILTAEKRVLNNSFEQAFESLKAMLTDENVTIFMKVDMAQISYPRQIGYIFSATADIPRIIKSNDIYDLPPGLFRDYQEAINASTGTITLTLPADEIVNASHLTDIVRRQVMMDVPIRFNGQTTFELSAKQDLQGNIFDGTIGAYIEEFLRLVLGEPDESFIEEQLRLRDIAILTTFGATVLIIVTLVIVIMVIIVKRRRYRDYYDDEDDDFYYDDD